MSIMSLALNENLTDEQFVALCNQRIESAEKLIDVMSQEAKKLDPKIRGRYVAQCLPIIIMSIM